MKFIRLVIFLFIFLFFPYWVSAQTSNCCQYLYAGQEPGFNDICFQGPAVAPCSSWGANYNSEFISNSSCQTNGYCTGYSTSTEVTQGCCQVSCAPGAPCGGGCYPLPCPYDNGNGLTVSVVEYGTCQSGICTTADYSTKDNGPVIFEPQVSIPGSISIGGKLFSINQGDEIVVDGSLLSKYIAILFNWLIGAIGVVTVAYLAFGGLQWLGAAGNASGINKAKETIRDALIGMLLVAGSYTMLYVINPNLVGFKILPITDVEAKKLYSGDNSDTGVADIMSDGNFYKQCDPRWGDMPYEQGGKGCTLCSSGCGSTAVAIVLAHLGLNETPATVGQYAMEIGARNGCANGTSVRTMVEKPKMSWGVRSETVTNFDQAMKLLEQNTWLVASIKQVPVEGKCKTTDCGKCFCSGHLIVLTGKNGDRINIMDPSRVGINSMTVEQFKKYNSYQEYYRFWK